MLVSRTTRIMHPAKRELYDRATRAALVSDCISSGEISLNPGQNGNGVNQAVCCIHAPRLGLRYGLSVTVGAQALTFTES